MPRSFIQPIQDPVEGCGHWEDGIGYKDGKIVPVSEWVAHCPYHPHWVRKGCERCREEATWTLKEVPSAP